jgi:hypothetical protein
VPRIVRVTPIIVGTETPADTIGTPLLGILTGHVGVIELDATVNDGDFETLAAVAVTERVTGRNVRTVGLRQGQGIALVLAIDEAVDPAPVHVAQGIFFHVTIVKL